VIDVPRLDLAPELDTSDPAQISEDLRVLEAQRQSLLLARFDNDVAFAIGLRVRHLASSRSQSVSVDVHGRTGRLFFCAMPGTSPNNSDWLRRKRNVVRLFERSSYEVARDLASRGTDLVLRQGLPLRDYSAVGGCVPIQVRGAGIVGDIGVSGLADREDHDLAVEALIEFMR